MKSRFTLTLAPALAATLLAACSTAPTTPDRAWSVEPTGGVSHAAQSAADYHALGRHSESAAPDEALAAYRKAVDLDPDFLPAWNALGMLHARLGRHDEAVSSLKQVVDKEPESSLLLNNLGYAKLLAGRNEAAATTLRHAVMVNGDNRRAWRNLAEASRRLGDHEGAERARARASGERTSHGEGMGRVMPVSMDGPEILAGGAAGGRAGGSAWHSSGPQLVKVAENIYELRSGSAPRTRSASRPSEPAVAPQQASVAMAPAQRNLSTGSGSVRYEVANGMGRSGLAGRVAGIMRDEGIASPQLSNQPPFNEPITMVEYREGFREAAEQLVASMPFSPALRSGPSNDIQSDVRLLLGHDLVTASKCATLDLCPVQGSGAAQAEADKVEAEGEELPSKDVPVSAVAGGSLSN